jgi:hypothetical protein
VKVNISIDDVTIHPRSNLSIMTHCDALIKVYPDIKFSFFIPTAYWRTMKRGTVTEDALNISRVPDFCDFIKSLPDKNFEIGYHGHYHGIPGKSDNDEFQYLNYDEAVQKIDTMFEESKKAGLYDKMKKIFRPPAWRLSPDSFRALSDKGFEVLALTNAPHAMESYEGQEKNYPCTFSNQYPPFSPLKVEDKCGIVYHACEWDKNYLNLDMKVQLDSFLMHSECEFVFLRDFL